MNIKHERLRGHPNDFGYVFDYRNFLVAAFPTLEISIDKLKCLLKAQGMGLRALRYDPISMAWDFAFYATTPQAWRKEKKL